MPLGLTQPLTEMFVLICQMLLASFVGPNIFLKIFLSNTESLCMMLSLRTHSNRNEYQEYSLGVKAAGA
jgi:hypothetical protein